jgi:hypothetical protein
MQRDILDWIDRKIKRLEQEPDSQPEDIPQELKQALAVLVQT